MLFIHYKDDPFPFERPLIVDLVIYADPSVPCVIEYCREHALIVQPGPERPTQSALAGKGLEVPRDLEQGVHDQGSQ